MDADLALLRDTSCILRVSSEKRQPTREKTYQVFLMINGIAGPILLGTAVATFFNGAEFIVNKEQLTDVAMPVISTWANPWHGLEAALVFWNLCLGLAVFFLARALALLYLSTISMIRRLSLKAGNN